MTYNVFGGTLNLAQLLAYGLLAGVTHLLGLLIAYGG